MTNVEWTNRVEFHDVAEALGITTDSVMAAHSRDGGYFWDVFYTETPTAESDEWIWAAVLWRNDKSGVLEVLRRYQFRKIGDFQRELEGHMERMEAEGHLPAREHDDAA